MSISDAPNPSEAPGFPPEGEVISTDRYVAPHLKPESYPGEFPSEPYVLMEGTRLFKVEYDADANVFNVHTAEGQHNLDEELTGLGVAPMHERFPVTVFGSNRNPGQLFDKFQPKPKKGEEPPDPKLAIVPMMRGTLKGYDAVYNAKVGNFGYFFADLYQGPETAETEIEVAVLFATREQLDIINESEKAYDYTLVGEVEFADTFFAHDPNGLKAQAISDVAGQPVSDNFGETYREWMKMERAGGKLKLAPRKAFQHALIDATGDEEQITVDPEQFKTDHLKVDWDKHKLPNMGEASAIYLSANII